VSNVYVGVDCSLRKPGLTVLSADAVVYCGSLKTKSSGAARLDAIAYYIADRLSGHLVAGSAIEGPSLKSQHREFDLGEGSGAAKLILFRASLGSAEPLVVPPTQLKLYAAGNGNADKDDVIHWVKEAWGYDVGDDDDAADSFALAHLARALDLGGVKRRCEAQVVHDILHPGAAKPRVKHRRSKENI